MSRRKTLLILVVLAAAWRLFLVANYHGWEESDFGNLAMTLGVVKGGFLHYDMNHLPLYYAVSAAVMTVVGSATVAAIGVSLVSGVGVVALTYLLAERLFNRRVALVTSVLAMVQPELALYSASSLREPLYAFALMMTAWLLTSRRGGSGGAGRLGAAALWAGAAFLTRMDALLIFPGVALVQALGEGRGAGERIKALLAMAIPFAAVVAAWSLYCHFEHGTWQFWGHSVAVNLETGGTVEAEESRLIKGLMVSGALLFEVIPSRIGWGPFVGYLYTIALVPWRKASSLRVVGLFSILLLGFWLGVGFVGQHEPGHNLYWKWLYGVLPLMLLFGAAGMLGVVDNLPVSPTARQAVLSLVLLQAFFAMLTETRRQVELSEELLGPQVELARWIEEEVPESTPMILDNVPERWLSRRDHGRPLHTWMDLPECPDGGQQCTWSAEEFSAWLLEEEIGWVLWYSEEWTTAPRVAPWLGSGGDWRGEGVTLAMERSSRLDEIDGWALYRVEPGR